MSQARHTRFLQLERIAICGLGLIGGSVLKALRDAGFRGHVTGFDVDDTTRKEVLAQGLADEMAASPDGLFLDQDLVVLCQPVGVLLEWLAAHKVQIAAGRAVFIDVASVKAPVVTALRAWPRPAAARFVPCHPIAGKASHGWAASQGDLFQGKPCVITPDANTAQDAVDLAHDFWRALGANTTTMAAPEHDAVYAAISHLPQVLSYAYLHSLALREGTAAWLAYRGTGFQTFARLGASDARLWADIAIHNAQPLIEEIDRISDSIALFRHYVSHGKFRELATAFSSARNFHARAGLMSDALIPLHEFPGAHHET
jgi:prephenate dehydrogenase